MTVGDINDAVENAIGGANVSETVEGRERYPIAVRYAREHGRPFFGICLGLQCAVIEFARNVRAKRYQPSGVDHFGNED